MFSYWQHRRACSQKRREIRDKIASLPDAYTEPLTDADTKILQLPLAQLVDACNTTQLSPSVILQAYAKRCLQAHTATNCIADPMFDEGLHTAVRVRAASSSRPLAGVPVSLKDVIDIAGHDSTVGYSAYASTPVPTSAPLVRLLQDAGAVLHVKTTAPTGLLSFETYSDLFGETTNPYHAAFSPGASTGGGGALLAYGGSCIEIGTDLGGSTRYPAAHCGLYSVKGSWGRFPASGCRTSTPGMDAVPTITAPLAGSLEDLREFWARVVDMRPWEYDQACVPIPWRPVDFVLAARTLKWGIIWDDGVIPPTPACVRALTWVVDALRKQGHEVVDFAPPEPLEGLKIGYQLMFTDKAHGIFAPLRTFESISPAIRTVRFLLLLPLFLKQLCAFLLGLFSRPRGRNHAWVSLLQVFHARSAREERVLIQQREEYRARWHDAWRAQHLDFVLTVPHALPPPPRGSSGTLTLVSANYAFLYNVLDYAAGVLPVTYVDREADALPADFAQSARYRQMNDIARGVHSVYDAAQMHGLPVGVQVVGGRFEEEKVIAGMGVVEQALREGGRAFERRQF